MSSSTISSQSSSDKYLRPAPYHAPKQPTKDTDTEADSWDNVELNSHLSVDAWKSKVRSEQSKKERSDDSTLRVKGMKWAASAMRL
jgi:hypothetical protein